MESYEGVENKKALSFSVNSGAHLPTTVTGACLPRGKQAFGEYLFCYVLEVYHLENEPKDQLVNRVSFLWD